MGAFFTNVQVRVVGSRVDAMARVAGHLEQLADGKVLRLARADEVPIRTLVVLPGDEWISVYDEATEDQDTSNLDALARGLSKATRGYTLSTLVHDSDVLELTLFRNGRVCDRFDSNPNYFVRVSRALRAKLAGDPKGWNDVIGTALKVKPFASTSLDALEQALAPLLPTRADSERLRGLIE